MSWVRISNHIAIVEGDIIAHLEAEDVYMAIKKKNFSFNGKQQGNIEDSFPNISFSPINKYATILIESKDGNISLSIVVCDMLVDFVKGRIIDQIIIKDNLYYIVNSEEINEILSKEKIYNNGQITISEYINLIKNSMSTDVIVDKVDKSKLKQKNIYNQPQFFVANLYEYQKIGFGWLDFMLENNHGCILGDEMGLGKTLQAIALIQKRKNENKKSLVIAPVSLLSNWKNECKKFAPNLNILVHHGSKRTGSIKEFYKYDLIITSYGHAITDNVLFCIHEWDLLILDEAQNIKNAESRRAKSIKNIPSKERLAVTGTPFENHITDIWSLFDFVMPGLLGNKQYFENLINDNFDGARKIEPLLTTIMLRRLVKDVANELPRKIVIPQEIMMSEEESVQYESLRQEILNCGKISLGMIQKLRMFCAHPLLINADEGQDPAKNSIKYQRTCEILEEIFNRNEKVIIFTSYRKMFDLFLYDLKRRFDIYMDYINGSTPVYERQKKVDEFNNYKSTATLILNPRAAGTGLNITSANHVIHYNLEWNPALEEQSSARAYRRGQTKTTFIYRLFYSKTIEEIMCKRIERKRDMAELAVVGKSGHDIDVQDIIKAINITPNGGIK